MPFAFLDLRIYEEVSIQGAFMLRDDLLLGLEVELHRLTLSFTFALGSHGTQKFEAT
jgi:hypothetical protein